MRRGKVCIYHCLNFDSLSTGMRAVESNLTSNSIRFVRIIDPDPEFTVPEIRRIYHSDGLITLLEVRSELGRAFYLFSTAEPFHLDGLSRSHFTVAFRLKGEESLEALMRVIFAREISGAKYRHRSSINFLVSFLTSMLLLSIWGIGSIMIQATVVGALALAIFMVIDYPFSVLYFKGVSVVPVPGPADKGFVLKIKIPREKKA